MRSRSFAPVAMLGLLMIVAGCGTTAPGGGAATPGRTTPATEATAPAGTAAAGCTTVGGGQAVSIVDNAFEPATLNVSVGDTVTWTNNGAVTHTVTFTGGPDCGDVGSGESVSRTFDTAGTFDYVCTIHPEMQASITVGQ